jgi:hypothetical protein
MLSLGASVVGYYDNKNNDYTLYLEIQPLSDNYVKEALEIARLSLQELKVKGMYLRKLWKNLLTDCKDIR